VVDAPDEAHGRMVQAIMVPRPGVATGPGLVRSVQNWVKSELAPRERPRLIEFRDALPRTETGKLQRFKLR